VNADNDNGSNIITTPSGGFTGLPTQRDFNVTHLNSDDNDMLTATVTANNIAGGGTWTTTLTQNGKGQVSLWQDPKKDNAFTGPPAGATTATFYIEGTHESAAAGDVTLKFKYTLNGISYTSPTLAITVTPLITAFTVTPAGGANGQNIIFTNGVDGSGGLSARPQPNVAGITYSSTVTQSALRTGQNGALSGGYKYVQNFTNVVNGNNGTRNGNGAAVGWLYQNNTAQVLQLQNGNFPVLDKLNTGGDQHYDADFNSQPSPDGSTVTITADDAPSTGNPANGNQDSTGRK
jgi:hypothetical protein